MAMVLNPIIWAAIVVSIMVGIAAYFIPARPMIEFFDGIAIAMSAAVMFGYGKRVITALTKHRTPDIYDMIIVGIAGGWLTNSADRMWRLWSRVTDNPEMLNHPFIVFVLAALSFFAALHLMVFGPTAEDVGSRRSVSPKAWATIGVSLFVGSAIGTFAVAIDRGLLEGW